MVCTIRFDIVVTTSTLFSNTDCNSVDQFTCDNGNCILRYRVCNMYNNCGDFSDERNCSCKLLLFVIPGYNKLLNNAYNLFLSILQTNAEYLILVNLFVGQVKNV